MSRKPPIVGLIPCGGHATRIAPLPCSKELLPVELKRCADGTERPKVVTEFLLEKMVRAGATRAFIIVRKGKWDILEYFGDGSDHGIRLGYLIMGAPHGPPYTANQARDFLPGARVLFGFPDVLFQPDTAFGTALARMDATKSDVVLGLFRAHDPRVMDMVDMSRNGRVRALLLKPGRTTLKWGYIFAVWGPRFTHFLAVHLKQLDAAGVASPSRERAELSMGHVFQVAIQAGLKVQSVTFPGGRYLDIGTPHALARVFRTQALTA